MMGRQSGQLSMMVMDLSELIPNNHLLRRISQVISFDFICYNVNNRVRHASQACFSRTHA